MSFFVAKIASGISPWILIVMIALHRYKNNRSSFLIAAHWYFMIFCVFATFKIGFHKSSSRLLFCHGYFSHIDHHSVRNIYWLVLVESRHILLLDMIKLKRKTWNLCRHLNSGLQIKNWIIKLCLLKIYFLYHICVDLFFL